MTEDELTLSVLQYLQRQRAQNANDQRGWTPVFAVAHDLGVDEERVRDEILLQNADQNVETRESPDFHPSSTMVCITLPGQTHLARLSKAKRRRAEQPFAESARDEQERFDHVAFVSHASDDVNFTSHLVDALEAAGVNVWYDRNHIAFGDSNIARMNEGLRRSRNGIIVVSKTYFRKTYTKPECNALLNLQINNDSRRRTIPILYGVTQAELREENPLLANYANIDSEKFSIREIADYLRGAFLTPAESRVSVDEIEAYSPTYTEIEASALVPGVNPGPYDKLPEQEHLMDRRPFIEIAWIKPRNVDGVPTVSWRLTNRGPGEAKDVGVFMAGIASYAVPHILAGESIVEERRFDDRYAYHMIMKPPVHLIVESGDVNGNVYRQYADVRSSAHFFGNPDYKTTQLGHPYPVSGRIVAADDGDRFHLDAPLDLPPIA